MARIDAGDGPGSGHRFGHFVAVLTYVWTAGRDLLNLVGFDYGALYTPAHFAACDALDDALADGRSAQNDRVGLHFAGAFAREPRGRRPGAWFFPNVPQVLLRMLNLDPDTTPDFETAQQEAFRDLFADNAGMPAFSRDRVLEFFGYAAGGGGGREPLSACKYRWALTYAQLLEVPFPRVRAALADILRGRPRMDEVSEHGEGDYLMRLAHVQKMAEYVANLVAQGADSEAGVLCLLRIGANDPKTGLPLERVHEQLKVSDDGHRLERVSAQSDSAAMAFWAEHGATTLRLRYLSAAPTERKWHFSCELAAGRCVPASNVFAASLNVTAVGEGSGGW